MGCSAAAHGAHNGPRFSGRAGADRRWKYEDRDALTAVMFG
jgi:hypothetical protein